MAAILYQEEKKGTKHRITNRLIQIFLYKFTLYTVLKFQFLIFLLLCIPAFSFQDNSYRFQNISIKDGLSQNTVKCMLQDNHGFIWLGTMNGLNRYDGLEFTVFMQEFGNKVSLSDNRIRTIQEDNHGYIWLQTNINNVNCYDTKTEKFVAYHPFSTNHTEVSIFKSGDVWLWGENSGCLQIVHDQNKLSTTFYGKDKLGSENIQFLFEGKDDNTWIGTSNSLFKLKNGILSPVLQDYDFQSSIESEGFIYCFTHQNKILVYDKKKERLVQEIQCPFHKHIKLNDIALLSEELILITTNKDTWIFNTRLMKIASALPYFNHKKLVNAYTYFDNKHNLWIYNNSGSIWQYNQSVGAFHEIKLIPQSILSFIDMERYTVFHDSRDIIWITTYGNGLFVIDQHTGIIKHFKQDNYESSGLRTNFLLSITEDNSGEIWIGTEYAGVSKISLTPEKNILFTPGEVNNTNEDKIVRLISEDENENLWIGTKKGNLFVYDQNFNVLQEHNISGGLPYAFASDSSGNIWIGTKGKGLLIFNKNNFSKYKVVDLPRLENNAELNNNLYSICKDTKGRMWLATFGNGLFLADYSNNKLSFRNLKKISKIQPRMRNIIQDNSGLIWIGGNNGVTVFDPDKLLESENLFKSYVFDNKNPQSINNNEVKVIFKDNENRIWIGTSGGGLNLAVRKNCNSAIQDFSFKHYTSEEGLINNVVQGILEDDNGNLWISTEGGISKFNVSTGRFENYNFSDNWQGNLFCESACYKRKNGDILFGSYLGLYILNQDFKADTSFSPPVKITKIKINGTEVTPDSKDSPLSKAACITKKIRLRYNQNSFTLQFAIMNFRNPSTNSFTYILEGYEEFWNPKTRHNVAVYRNIPVGNYIFKVKGCNSLGIWNNQETQLEIKIIPPAWRSPIALILYTLLIFSGGLITARILIKINKLNTAVAVEQQLTEYKLQFFTNISHEFRSPLTIICGTIENLNQKKELNPSIHRQLNLLENSSHRLLRLINQLLTFRQIQYNKLVLKTIPTESVAFFKNIFNQFEELAIKKGINYSFKSNLTSCNILLDQGKTDKIIFNLLSNAFRFTPKNGKISLELIINQSNNLLKVKVSDSGPGIPKDKQHLLFTRFKQFHPASGGTGIGLNLAAELAKIHNGNIIYEDSVYGGACFIMEIPISDSITSSQGTIKEQEENEISLVKKEHSSNQLHEENQNTKRYKILVIDDDSDINEFLSLKLSEYFKVITAANGKDGLKASTSEQPDLIICDVMMPEINGFEVTKKLRTNFETCHIPIIMLTAYSSMDQQIEGIDSGADAYIIKPFSLKYLLTRVIKLLEQREILQQKFTRTPGLLELPEFANNKDHTFLKEIHIIIEDNLNNPDFSMDIFASKMKKSRTAFFKKVKGLTGYTPNDYLRILRMKKAAELLATTNLNVSEIAFRVGINNPFYFTKCFKNQFGITPSAFAKKENKF